MRHDRLRFASGNRLATRWPLKKSTRIMMERPGRAGVASTQRNSVVLLDTTTTRNRSMASTGFLWASTTHQHQWLAYCADNGYLIRWNSSKCLFITWSEKQMRWFLNYSDSIMTILSALFVHGAQSIWFISIRNRLIGRYWRRSTSITRTLSK